MNWKAIGKWTALASIAFCVVSCTTSKKTTKPNSSGYYNAENAKLGAVYKNRQMMPSYMHFARVSSVENKQNIVNGHDFIQQLNNVRAYSGNITGRYAGVYSKIQRWVSAGANVDDLAKYGINANLMRGQDGFQNVNLTGYYAPVLQARRFPQGEFQHPLYRLPANKRFTRAQIYNGALAGQGKNGFKYASIGRLLVEDGEIPKEKMSAQAIKDWAKRNPGRTQSLLERNPSYVFFKFDDTHEVKGSAGVPLVALASVASDKSIVPSGSVVLVEMPLINDHGDFTGKYEMRLMVALDVGGAVKGHHFDIYQGVEGIHKKAAQTAGLLKHFGRVWVLN